MRIRSRLALVAGFGVIAASGSADAVVLTWDSDSTTTADIVDGPGNWNLTAGNTVWRDGASNVLWTTLSDAVFGGTTGTPGQVTITTAITPNSMTFNVDGYTVADTSTGNRLILASPGGITANGTATVKTFRAALSQTESQTWTVAPGKSFTMDATPGANTSQFFVGGNSDSGKTLTLGGGGTVNFIASSNTFGLNVPQNSNLVVNNALVTATGRTTAANLDDVAVVMRGRTGAGLASKTFINAGGTIDVGLNTVTVQMNVDGVTQMPLGVPAELHLDGGTIALASFGNATAATPLSSTGVLYFNGGEVKANKSNPNFMVAPFVAGVGGSGLSAVYVAAAGANINTNGFDITVATPLIPDPSSAGGGFTKKGVGTLTMTAVSSYTGGTNVHAGTLEVKRLHENNAVSISAAAKLKVLDSSPTLPGHPSGDDAFVSRPSALTIAAGGTLDLTNNDLVLDYSGASPIATYEALVASAFNVGVGDWSGTGITSSVAQADGNYVVAIADNAALAAPFGTANGGPLFAGVDVDIDTILIKFTHRADVDLDGVITPNDAAIFGGNYSENDPAVWSTGDMDYDGIFTPNDAAIFGGFYDESLASLPEPGSLTVLALLGLGLARRRRSRGV